MILNRYNQNLNTGDNIMASSTTGTNTSHNSSSYTALDVLLNSSASDTSVTSSHSINPTPMSSEYSLSNRSSLADVSFNALESISNDINNLNSLNTINSINSLNDSFDNDASTIDVNNINNAENNPSSVMNNLWNSTSDNSNLPSNSTFINWNPNYLSSNPNNNHNDNPILSKPTSPVPQSFATLRNSKNLQFSSNDPFLPADLKTSDMATINNTSLDDAIYKINSSESLYKCLSNHLLSNISKATTNTNLNNESLLNNQFLNKPAFPLNNNTMAGYSWNANVGLLNISDDLNNHQSSSSYSNSSTASSVCDDLINHSYYQNHLNNINHANNPSPNNTNIHHTNSNHLNKNKTDRSLFKTELCATFQKTGFCPYNDKCQFAHGLDELKSAPKSRKWKTKMCKNWTEKGHCRYGKRCCYKHGENDDGSSVNSLFPPHVVLKH